MFLTSDFFKSLVNGVGIFFGVCLGIGIIVFVLGFLAGLNHGFSNAEPTVAQEPTKTSTSNDIPSEINLAIGETAQTSVEEVTVSNAELGNSYEYYSDYLGNRVKTAPPGKKFLLIKALVRNVGANRIYANSSSFSVTDLEGNAYDTEIMSGENNFPFLQELYQNQKAEGFILFKLPAEAKNVKILYDFGDLISEVKLASWDVPQADENATSPEIEIQLQDDANFSSSADEIRIYYSVNGVTHDNKYSIHIYERLFNEKGEQLWDKTFDHGKETGDAEGPLNFNLYFEPKQHPEKYPAGKYTLEITIVDYITDKNSSKSAEFQITN